MYKITKHPIYGFCCEIDVPETLQMNRETIKTIENMANCEIVFEDGFAKCENFEIN